jgi:ectoine hydroxylase-related dioxygenase (phytanoyl-CoA dioxygenase family)
MSDLSRCHRPVSGLFDPQHRQQDREAFRLEAGQLAFFREHGYVAGIRVLEEQQAEHLRNELETFFQEDHAGFEYWHEYHRNESADPGHVLFHALGAWRLRPGFHDLLWNPAVTIPASQLLEGPVRFWHDQLFCKPPRQGGVVSWHQDYSYWTRTRPMQHLTCWIALDDATSENGCLQYVSGSHCWDLLPVTGLAGDMHAIREVLSDRQWQQLQDPVLVELQAGECAFHHPLTVHGSGVNRSDRPRRATVLNLARDGVCSFSEEPLLQGIPTIPRGQPLAGRFFPLLLQPD